MMKTIVSTIAILALLVAPLAVVTAGCIGAPDSTENLGTAEGALGESGCTSLVAYASGTISPDCTDVDRIYNESTSTSYGVTACPHQYPVAFASASTATQYVGLAKFKSLPTTQAKCATAEVGIAMWQKFCSGFCTLTLEGTDTAQGFWDSGTSKCIIGDAFVNGAPAGGSTNYIVTAYARTSSTDYRNVGVALAPTSAGCP